VSVSSQESSWLRRASTTGAFTPSVASTVNDLWQYRELFYFFIWRDLKVRYAQSILGIGWAVIQPLVPMLIFTLVFGRLARISSDGVPYALFSYTALVPWTYFANALSDASASLAKETHMLSKIYFPRLVIPLTAVLGRLIDLAISFVLLVLLMAWYNVVPSAWTVLLPLLVLVTSVAAAGLGIGMSALALQYRDVKYAAPFVVQLLMYAAPVVYPTSLLPEWVRPLYALNPMVGVIEGFRASLLSSTPVPWDLIAIGSLSSVAMLMMGMIYFIRKEPVFADVA
jgi:homopolymeric O-antigen transport system permease protein